MNTQIGGGATGSKEVPQLVPFPATERPTSPTPQTSAAPKRITSRNWTIGAIIVLLLVAGTAVLWWSTGTSNTVRYVTAPVTTGPITRGVTATGTVNPELTIIVGTYVSGVIQDVTCDYNTQVKRGQLCAKIDARPYQTLVDQAKANLSVAQAQLEKDQASLAYAKLSFDRSAALIRTNAISKDVFDNAQSQYEQAQAQISFDRATIEQRQAALEAAQVNLDYTNIISPVNGTVVARNVTIGQTVAASFQTPTLFLIATDLTKMQVDANVSESDIGEIKLGDKATFTVDAYTKRVFDGTVTQVRQSPQTVQNVVTYDVVVSTANADLALKPGLTAATRIVVDQRSNVLRVPNQALRYIPSGNAMRESDHARVWVLRDGKPASVQVTAGLDDDNYTEIAQGDLKQGDKVIVAEQRNSTGPRSSVPQPRF
jgi:HlyD family secretion protein